LLDENLDPKESYRVLDRLINQECTTRLVLRTDSQGTLRFRGFRGKYRVQATAAGSSRTAQWDLTGSDPAKLVLTLN
jgi:hypothetical protein